MTSHQEFTYMPKLTKEYELNELDMLPKDYATFLTECAQIYCTQAFPKIPKDDKFFRPNFNMVGQMRYSHPDNQTKKLQSGICKAPTYWENIDGGEQLDAHQPDFAFKVQEIIQHMNTQLDQRFPDREGKFPTRTYLKKLDLLSESIEIYTTIRYDMLPLHLDISLKSNLGTMQDIRQKYLWVGEPILKITLTEQCTKYSKLEAMMEHIELAVESHYTFDRRKTIQEHTDRGVVELAEEKRARIQVA